ncbi:glutamate racemase [Thermosporothrix hazakensis]|jgi:glutamate racemase|uniref:Glutamate racemase n=1 Tax=Thermosporothrix hazakensis TaxID=644383 RepID=A0A326UFU4_THEHA|nr:glutamate racemase [Thermosporothrix hazakensis]PZW36775.1 glutamate racemase [Thermosporothrix hazakensis]GCE47425.1 glutamate racemase [Thermosporothrix hazakensis]
MTQQILRNQEHTSEQKTRGDRRGRPSAPIGVFDSGAGGLTILADLRKQLPHEHFVFFGDTLNNPYGPRTDAEVRELAQLATRFLLEQDVKMIVVACNTASQAALETLRMAFPQLPFVGVVPAVKPAARLSQKRRIGVVATNGSVKAAYLQNLIATHAAGVEVAVAACPELVTLVEQGRIEGPEVDVILRQSLRPVLEKDIDVLVLGCTHFPALRLAIEKIVGENVQVIDSGSAIARRTQWVLETEELLRPAEQEERGTVQLWSSGDATAFQRTASVILGYPVTVTQAKNYPQVSG